MPVSRESRDASAARFLKVVEVNEGKDSESEGSSPGLSGSQSSDDGSSCRFGRWAAFASLVGFALVGVGSYMMFREQPALAGAGSKAGDYSGEQTTQAPIHIPVEAEKVKMPMLSDNPLLTQSWNVELLTDMCKGRVIEGAAGDQDEAFDDDDEDDADEAAFADSYEADDQRPNATQSRRLMDAQVATDGIRRFKLSNGATMPYYGSQDVQQEEPSGAEFAVFIFHGAVRDAINYFCAGKWVMEQQSKYPLEKALLIVMKWHYKIDMPNDLDVWWNSSKPWGSWMAGGHSDHLSGAAMSSFDVIDEFIVYLADNPFKYPNLKEILLMGHSAGGQTLQRYSFATYLKPPHLSTPEDVRNKRGIRSDLDVRFVIANPSSYLYLDKKRWAYQCEDEETPTGCSTPAYMDYDAEQGRHSWDVDFEYGDKGWRTTEGLGKPGKDYPFICRATGFNNWFYGLNWQHLSDGYIIPYLGEHPDVKEAISVFPERDVVYLVGQNDTCWDDEFPFCDQECWQRNKPTMKCYRNHLDMRCPAMLQGPNRKTRGMHYIRHLYEFYHRPVHDLFVVPGVGHEGGRILTSEYGKIAIEGNVDQILHLAVSPLSVPLGPVGYVAPISPPPPPPPELPGAGTATESEIESTETEKEIESKIAKA